MRLYGDKREIFRFYFDFNLGTRKCYLSVTNE